MPLAFQLAIETIFTSYLLPALLIPLVWGGWALARRARGPAAFAKADTGRTLQRLHGVAASSLLLLWLGSHLGIRIENGGRPLTLAVWIAFGSMNLFFACLAMSVTAEYGSLPAGRKRDTKFLAFIGATLVQPLATAATFTLLYRLLRVVSHQKFPWPEVIPQGI